MSRLMTRQMRRASEANGRRLQRKEWNAFQDVTQESKDRHLALNPGSTFSPDRVWMNNKYVVQAFNNRGFLGFDCTKLMIRRCDAEPVFSWPDLQHIKNEALRSRGDGDPEFPARERVGRRRQPLLALGAEARGGEMSASMGSRNVNARISDEDAWTIRRARQGVPRWLPADDPRSTSSLAKRFGITPSQISKIALGRQWRHHLRGGK